MTRNEDGFTLLEVLVAFVILTSALGILYQILMTGGMRSEKARLEQGALLLAQSKLSEAAVFGHNANGREDIYSWDLSWQANRLTSARERRNPVRLAHVTVTVSWGEGERKQQIRLDTLRPETAN